MNVEALKHNISSSRTDLMGFAIICILIEHFQFFGLFDYGDLSFFASLGSIGVDVFLFLSGFGLLCGYDKYTSVWDYYKRRFLRIIPTYALLMILFDIITLHPENIIRPDVWEGHLSNNWFIPFILLMYLIFPFAVQIQRRWLYAPISIACLLSALLTILFQVNGKGDIHAVPMLMAQRLPIFFMGMLFADRRMILPDIQKRYIVLCFLVSLFTLYFFYWICDVQWSKYILFIPMTFCIIALLSENFTHTPNRILRYLGKYTLEMYLISLFLMQQMSDFYEGRYVKIKAAAIIFLTWGGAVVIHKMMGLVLKKRKGIKV